MYAGQHVFAVHQFIHAGQLCHMACALNSTQMIRTFMLLLLFLCFFAEGLVAQASGELSTGSRRARRAYEEAAQAYRRYDHDQAIERLERAIRIDDSFIEAHLLKAEIFYMDEAYEQAIRHYARSITLDASFFPPAKYYKGWALFRTAAYGRAVYWLETFKETDGISVSFQSRVQHALTHARFAEEAMQNPVPFDPQNMGPAINSEYAEYSPALTADEQTLIFTRKKPLEGYELHEDLPRDFFYEDFYISQLEDGEWTKAQNMGAPLNTPGNEGAQTITADGRHMYFTACNRPDGIGSCDIYHTRKVGREWSVPQNAGRPLNSSSWDSQPAVSADGKTLYFASSREGSIGSMDIWKARKKDDGQWGEPENLGKTINTSGKELSPFIHHDNETLYFASDGHPGMGGLDIFVSRRDPETGAWSEPQNLGYPINTHRDEFAFVVGASGQQAWFASDMEGGHGRSDIYTFSLYDAVSPQPVTYMRGVVSDAETDKPLQASFELIRVSDRQVVMEAASDPEDGTFLVAIPTGQDLALNISNPGYLFFSDHFSYDGIRKATDPYIRDIELHPIREGEAVVLRNIFFETDSHALKETSMAELQKLYRFMRKNPDVHIEISGHTDSRGTYAHNLALSENRARSVRDYLIDQGIPGSRLTYKGYADTKPVDTNETPEGRAMNRRTAFKIIKSQDR